MDQVCAWYQISRQAHYQMKRRQHQQHKAEEVVLALVRQKRQRHKRMGGRKLWQQLQPTWASQGIQLGRDRFFEVLGRHDLLLQPKKRATRTTWAGKWRYENLLAEATITQPNQAWLSDLTYIATEAGFVYLALVTDLHSRRIMGFDLSNSLCLEGALRALQMAIKQAAQPLKGLIHHSDHGVQYTSDPYQALLNRHEIRPSMGQIGNCYDNAVAERVNGILKLEYGLDELFVNQQQALLAVIEAIWLYNHDRPHLSLAYQTPVQVYEQHTYSH
jgi:transposase InsO family protein